VSDLDRSIRFYTDLIRFRVVADTEVTGTPWEQLTGVFGVRMRVARLRLGVEEIELTQYLAPEGRPAPVDTRSNDRWFQHIAIVVSDMDSAYRVLRRGKARHASTGPQLLPHSNPAAGGIRAFYFKDPDGHHLELIWFPAGKGDPRWQPAEADRDARPLFQGIDHTAIVVEDTERSLRFYRGRLGLRVAGTSWNSGIEQERLNNVEGARLRITGLRAAGGPGIEFLEYLSPSDGRPYPPDARPNDLIHWHTTLLTSGGNSLTSVSGSARVLSRRIADLPSAPLGFSRGVLLRDPDGHALLLVDP
jgi:catechol 2,3-dioxygenase-like lactoylglutathione lyase family enzyme